MTTDPTASWSMREHKIALGAFALLTALITLFLLRDASAFVDSPRDQLLGHIGASGGFTMAAAGALLVARRRRPHTLEIMAAGVAITVALELAQAFAPTRGVELSDVALGFSGVLVATIGIEFLLAILSLRATSLTHTAMALGGSALLIILLVGDLAPETLSSAVPDGIDCPLTALSGEPVRIDLGSELDLDGSCLVTAQAGGLSLFGPAGERTTNPNSVLVSSAVDELVTTVLEQERIVVRAQVVTAGFSDNPRLPGVIVGLRVRDGNEIISLRARDQRVEVVAPNLATRYRSLAYIQALQPDTRHLIEVELTRTEARTTVDGVLVGILAVDPGWLDELQNIDEPQAQIYLGNGPGRTTPFLGVIEWVEIET